MKCPICGEPLLNGSYKCLRCGYEFSGVATVAPNSEKEGQEKNNEPIETREINPQTVHITKNGGGSLFDNLFGESVFGGFGGFGDIIGNLFGGIFGAEDEPDGYDDDPKYYDDFGNEIFVPDEFERDCVEIREVEFYEESTKKRKDKPNNGNKKNP